jgi:lactate dehydrogenase-like 2-hydroxyacid dehydrogenase
MISVSGDSAFSVRHMTRVYVTRDLPSPILNPLSDRFDVDVWFGDRPVPREVLLAAASTSEGLLCMVNDLVDGTLLEASPSLRVISQMAVGVDNVDLAECSKRGIAVGHTPGVLTGTVADTAFTLLGAVVRRFPEGEAEVRSGTWGPWSPFHLTGGDLHGTILGIIGMGRIGRAVARRSQGFDMSVIYTSPREASEVEAERMDLDQLLEIADNVMICAALTDETRGLIGKDELTRMKPSACLINVARGPIVDTDALAAALEAGEIAGAGLDVTDPEPIPPNHPLLALANCLILPHIGSASVKTRHRMAGLAVENLIAGLEGHQMPARHPAGG